MRCSASSTTSIVREPLPAVRGAVEATLFAAALAPLAKSLGFTGELVVDAVARRLFSSSATGSGDGRS